MKSTQDPGSDNNDEPGAHYKRASSALGFEGKSFEFPGMDRQGEETDHGEERGYLEDTAGCGFWRFFFGGRFDLLQDFLQVGMREIVAVEDYGADFLGIGNVGQGIGFENDQVGDFSGFDSAQPGFHIEEFGGI